MVRSVVVGGNFPEREYKLFMFSCNLPGTSSILVWEGGGVSATTFPPTRV